MRVIYTHLRFDDPENICVRCGMRGHRSHQCKVTLPTKIFNFDLFS